MEYLNNKAVAELINDGIEYRKSAQTALRLPKAEELNKDMPTFVKDGDSVRQESLSVVTSNNVIARNLQPIGKDSQGNDMYNEWPISKEVVIKNYGQAVLDNLTEEYSNHKKIQTIKAITLTPEVMDILGVNGDTLDIKVSWSDTPMKAKLGDCLTSGGYSISKHDMLDYEAVGMEKKDLLTSINSVRKDSEEPKSTNTNTMKNN